MQNNHFQHSKSSFTHLFTFSYSPHFYKYIHTNNSNKAIPHTNTLHISTIWYYRQITYNPYSLYWFFKRQYGSVQFQPSPFFNLTIPIYLGTRPRSEFFYQQWNAPLWGTLFHLTHSALYTFVLHSIDMINLEIYRLVNSKLCNS